MVRGSWCAGRLRGRLNRSHLLDRPGEEDDRVLVRVRHGQAEPDEEDDDAEHAKERTRHGEPHGLRFDLSDLHGLLLVSAPETYHAASGPGKNIIAARPPDPAAGNPDRILSLYESRGFAAFAGWS